MRRFSVFNEYTQLKEVIVCRPSNYSQVDPINEVEEHYLKNDPPTRNQLVAEHDQWTKILKELGVKVYYLDSVQGMPHQLFTRDVGFGIGENFFIANMAKAIRKKETDLLKQWLGENKISYQTIPNGLIEGGDVLVHHPYVFVGLSQRTNSAGIKSLTQLLGSYWKVVPIRLAPNVLHLDCVLAILNTNTIIWCPELIKSNHAFFKKTFPLRIEITREEYFHMGANVLSVDPSNILIEAKQLRLQKELKKHGIQIYPIDWLEIKKLGGLFRCASCPLS